jgi:sugar phosphate isomerase/epimerase
MLLGRVHTLSGRIAEAIDLLERAQSEYCVRQSWGPAVEGRVYLGEAYRLAHRPEDARAIGVEALRLARQCGLRGIEAYALRLLAEVAIHADPPEVEAAHDRYDEALALATLLGMRPLVAHCHLGLGTLSRRTGDEAKAHAHPTTATTMYREMGMDLWLAQAETAPTGVG